MMDEEPKPWLIEGVLGEGDVAMVTGLPGSGKTFVALAIGAAIAKGEGDFAGRFRVNGQRPVVYACGEKRRGIPARVRAAIAAEGLDDAPIFDASPLPQLFDREAGLWVEDFCEQLVRVVPEPGLVIIDTLNRATIGMKENAAEDMGVAIASASWIAESLRTAVLLVHHSPKNDPDGSRGSNSLEGAVDTALAVVRSTSGRRTLNATKQGDAEEFASIVFRLLPDKTGKSMYVEWSSDRTTKSEGPTNATDRLVQALGAEAWLSAEEIADRAGVPLKTAQNTLSGLAKKGGVARRRTDENAAASRANPFVYRRPDVPEE